jgi:replicative DNA helicase
VKPLDDNARRMAGEVLDPFEGEPMPHPDGRTGPWAHLPIEPHPDLAEAGAGEALPLFPTHVLPHPLRAFVEAVAATTQTDPGLAGTLALGACSACVAGKARVYLGGSHSEPLNLMTVAALGPAERKSGAHALCVEPIEEFEEYLIETTKGVRAAAAAKRKAIDEAVASARRRLPRAGSDRASLETEIADLVRERDAIQQAEEPCLLISDTTPEKVAQVLQDQQGRICIAEPEGTAFSNMLGRYGDEGSANIEIFLKGHAGDPIKVDRMGRSKIRVRRPAISTVLAVQPDVIRSAGTRPGVRERGLIGRLLMALPASMVGRRRARAPGVPSETRSAYRSALFALLRIAGPAPGESAPRVELTEGALAAYETFFEGVEGRLAPGGDLASMRDWGGKLPGAVARIAGVLHFVEAAGRGSLVEARWPIEDATMLAAVEVGHYFLAHARVIYGELLAAPAERRARDRHAAALVNLGWLFGGGREFTTAEPLEALWPNVKVPPPPGAQYAREALAVFAGTRADAGPSKDDLGYALRGAVGKPAVGLVLERAGKAHNKLAKWKVVPAPSAEGR